MAAASFPGWAMLDLFVFRRDDAGGSFPDREAAPVRGSASTSLASPFSVAFRLAEPPAISHLYLHWPAGPDQKKEGSCCYLVAAHRDLLLFRLDDVTDNTTDPFMHLAVDHFICRASSSSPSSPLLLKRIPLCAEPMVLGTREETGEEITMPRPYFTHNIGILCRGGEEEEEEEAEFAMAQLCIINDVPGHNNRLEAEVCVLRSRVPSSHDDDCAGAAGDWEVKHLPIIHAEDEFLDLSYWCVDAVIPFKGYMCFVDYYRGGILFYHAFGEERPEVISYLRLPIRQHPRAPGRKKEFNDFSRRLCVTNGGDVLRFIDIVRNDGEFIRPLKPGSGFTIISHSLTTLTTSKTESWEKDYEITSDQLWDLNTSSCLPREALTFPLVNMDKPHLVYFLISELASKEIIKKDPRRCGKDMVSMVTIDMSTKLAVSILPYIHGSEDEDMVWEKDRSLEHFLPTELPKFLDFTRKTKKHRCGKEEASGMTVISKKRRHYVRTCMGSIDNAAQFL